MTPPRPIRGDCMISLKITLTAAAPHDIINRCFREIWQDQFYDFYDSDDVFTHLAHNLIENGVEDISRLDGWGDIPPGAAILSIDW